MDYVSEDYFDKYLPRIVKKMEGKPLATKLLMHRSFSNGAYILSLLTDVPFAAVTVAEYYLCKDIVFKDLVRQFDAELELAKIDPDKFIMGLHSFYNNISAKIRKEHKQREFAEYLGLLQRIQVDARKKTGYREICAYQNLVLQAQEYLRPNKLDLERDICGISLRSGDFLTAPALYPFFDVAPLEVDIEYGKTRSFKVSPGQLLKRYRENGVDIDDIDDITAYEQIVRIHGNTFAAMMPFINEFTYDMLPVNAFGNQFNPLEDLVAKHRIDDIEHVLQHRRRTLPANGTEFLIEDPFDELKRVVLKEIYALDSFYLLYKIETIHGDLCGYYDVLDPFFFSIAVTAQRAIDDSAFRDLILLLYASQVLPAEMVPELNSLFMKRKLSVKIEAYGKGGKLRNQYQPEDPRGALDQSLYVAEDANIAGYIRKLPEGSKASDEAKAAARLLGYELADDETFVRPFVKSVFVRKDKAEGAG